MKLAAQIVRAAAIRGHSLGNTKIFPEQTWAKRRKTMAIPKALTQCVSSQHDALGNSPPSCGLALDVIAVIPLDILVNAPASARLRPLKTAAALPDLHFVASRPATPTNFAAQKVAEIAMLVAQPATTSTRRY